MFQKVGLEFVLHIQGGVILISHYASQGLWRSNSVGQFDLFGWITVKNCLRSLSAFQKRPNLPYKVSANDLL